MKICWCGLIMAVLIIVLVWWWTPSWADWGITVLAALLAVKSFWGGCCCGQKACDPEKK
ncbi:MAG: hypothetical protein V1684_02050 [bacterium]